MDSAIELYCSLQYRVQYLWGGCMGVLWDRGDLQCYPRSYYTTSSLRFVPIKYPTVRSPPPQPAANPSIAAAWDHYSH